MADTQENILVLVSVIDQATAHLKDISKSLERTQKPMQQIQKDTAKINKEFQTGGIRTLSMIFVMRRLGDTLTNLLKPAMDAFGIFDLWSATLTVVFVPIMETLFPILLSIMEAFMNLPDPMKQALGALVLFLFAATQLGEAILMFKLLGDAAASFGASTASGAGQANVGIAGLTTSAGWQSLITWALRGIGIGLAIYGVSELIKGGADSVSGLLNILAGAGFILGGPAGIAVGIGLLVLNVLIPEEDKKKIMDDLTELVNFKPVKAATPGGLSSNNMFTSNIPSSTTDLSIHSEKIQKQIDDLGKKSGVVFNGIYIDASLATKQTSQTWDEGTNQWSQTLDVASNSIDKQWKNTMDSMKTNTITTVEDIRKKLQELGMKNIDESISSSSSGGGAFDITGGGKGGKYGFGESSGHVIYNGPVGYGDDFIWRPGGGMANINPGDTLVGFKGAPPNFNAGSSGASASLSYSPVYNVSSAVDKLQFQKMLQDHDRVLFDQIRRLGKTGA